MVDLGVAAVSWPDDRERLVGFLTGNGWPFHGVAAPTEADVDAMPFVDDATSSWWIVEGDEPCGLVRLLDLDDIPDGSPVFDVRVVETARGRGVGAFAVRWLTEHLFTTYPDLHRIEATTRDDNVAMQRVLERCGYTCEGRLRESWPAADGRRFDTLVYGMLRSDPRDAT